MLNRIRQQFTAFWERQTNTQRAVLVILLVAGVGLVAVFSAWANTTTYEVAFTGLSEADAGQIVEKLAADDIPYQLRGSGTILVASEKVYDVRLSMARQGLPEGGTVGYELFSGTTLGMTEFTQRVNYQRALEGELERTIGSLAVVNAVRVHIVTPEKSLLASEQAPTTASVTLQLKAGQNLDAGQVRSITHLVASSVEGLKPENVVVVDVDGTLLASGGDNEAGGAASQTDGYRAAEAAYAAQIQSKVRTLLDNVLGPNKSVVQANVTMDWSQRDVVTQGFDPEASVIRSSQTLTETFNGGADAVGGIPGAASNLPDIGATGAITGTQTAQYARLENTLNYEISQTESHEVIAPGQVQRLSLSVMVDGVDDPDQLDTLRTVIAAAAGIDETRGDVLAVETLAFDRTVAEAEAADMTKGAQTELYMEFGTIVLAVLGVAGLLWYVSRLLAGLRLASADAWQPVLKPVSEAALAAAPVVRSLPPAPVAEIARITAAAKPTMDPEDQQLQKALVHMAEDDPASVAEIIHLWLSEDDKSHA